MLADGKNISRLKDIAMFLNLSWYIWKILFYLKKLSQGRDFFRNSILNLIIN